MDISRFPEVREGERRWEKVRAYKGSRRDGKKKNILALEATLLALRTL
jgi:hypothetical protein